MPWALAVPILNDELLSSWLARAALRQGCDPLVLTGTIWPKWRIWTRDPDRGLDAEHLVMLVRASGLSAQRFQAASMRPLAEIVHGEALPMGTWPWFLAFGTRNRRHHGGLQCCPVCLDGDEQPYFRRAWRLASHTVCTLHGIQLIDRCPICIAPLEPHRLLAEDRHLACCAHCRSDLRRSPRLAAPEAALRFQWHAEQALMNGEGVFGNQRLPARDWFSLARCLLGLLRQAALHQTRPILGCLSALGVDTGCLCTPATGLALELLPVAERAALLAALCHLLDAGAQRFLDAAQAAMMTSNALRGTNSAECEVVQHLIDGLPVQRHSHQRPPSSGCSCPRSKQAVQRMYACLCRRVPR